MISMIEDLFKNNALAKILDFLLDEPSYDFSQSDIKRETGLSWKTVHELFPLLEKLKIIVPTRTINRAKLYTVNTAAPVFKYLQQLDLEISTIINQEIAIQEIAKEENKKQKMVATASS